MCTEGRFVASNSCEIALTRLTPIAAAQAVLSNPARCAWAESSINWQISLEAHMRTLALVLVAAVLSPCCVAQTTKPTHPTTPATTTSKPTACQTVLKCRAELKEATEAANQFSNIA